MDFTARKDVHVKDGFVVCEVCEQRFEKFDVYLRPWLNVMNEGANPRSAAGADLKTAIHARCVEPVHEGLKPNQLDQAPREQVIEAIKQFALDLYNKDEALLHELYVFCHDALKQRR